MKSWKFFVITLVMVVNLILALPALAGLGEAAKMSDHFAEGQSVIWHYQAHSKTSDIHHVPAEIVKLGSKKVQIKVKRNNGEFVKRWVNQDKLEKPNH